MSQLEQAANTAIFQNQMRFSRAVEFVMARASVDQASAEKALRSVMLWYRG